MAKKSKTTARPTAKPLSISNGLITVLFFFSGFFILCLIWNQLNYVQIDLGGHLASGTWFQRGKIFY